MTVLLVVAFGAFAIAAGRRWLLLRTGRSADRFDRLGDRVKAVWRYAFVQEKMDYYQPAGIAHKLIFIGFVVLLLRTLILWGRGFSPSWNLLVLAPWMPLGKVYEFMKDTVGLMVITGVCIFFYYRVIRPMKRTTLSTEGLVILGIIFTMMVADMVYDGAAFVLAERDTSLCGITGHELVSADQCKAIATIVAPYGDEGHVGWSPFPSPAGTFFAMLFQGLSPTLLIVLAHAGFWIHSALVLLFLNLLPHSKHFHVITAIPNVFFRDLAPAGRLPLISATLPTPAPAADAPSTEGAAEGATEAAPPEKKPYSETLMELVGAAGESEDPTALPIGVGRIEHFSWKAILDFYTCTECGRCSDNCPAHRTGKVLSPKHLTLDLRNHLYSREKEFIHQKKENSSPEPKKEDASSQPNAEGAAEATKTANGVQAIDLVSNIIHPDVLWGCTTCRACEEQCPVMISYVDKIVDMRRNLVLVKGEFPHELQKPFQGMEVNGNPWNLSRMDRAGWAEGLEIPTFAERPNTPVLFWVGCAASYDDRAKKIARATARLLKKAGVDFAILAEEENCTGDPARRAGNEFLFAMLAETNAAVLNGYKEQGGIRQIVTTCPHCFNTLKNEYPDFDAKFEVVHHTDYLLGLLAQKKLDPQNPVTGRVVYHDSCYLGRYNGIFDSPRDILRAIPGVELVEAEYWTRQRGLCCGAGGAQMFMEEQNQNRVNVKRTLQLVDAVKQGTVASACPFCMTMLTDGLKSQNLEERYTTMDVAELLDRSCEETAIALPPTELPAVDLSIASNVDGEVNAPPPPGE
ncbi:(Fe-S)-binding protein [Pendulispora brunnea]|uniref:(Fe-S)-binding protein n=1 Tax=Pendulispora brunnea TaxID=2905690 RepID=A0ABZ2K0I7_9BACT